MTAIIETFGLCKTYGSSPGIEALTLVAVAPAATGAQPVDRRDVL